MANDEYDVSGRYIPFRVLCLFFSMVKANLDG